MQGAAMTLELAGLLAVVLFLLALLRVAEPLTR